MFFANHTTTGPGAVRLVGCPDDGRSCNPYINFLTTPPSGHCQTHGTPFSTEPPAV